MTAMSFVDISTKNTKNEILEAYHEALDLIKELKKTNKQEIKQEKDKRDTVVSASANTSKDIFKNLADLKLSIVDSLESLSHQLLSEHKKLVILQEAINLQSKELEELHEIKVNTDTLTALLEAQKQKKNNPVFVW